MSSKEPGGQKEFQGSLWGGLGTHRFRGMVRVRRCSLLPCNQIPRNLLATQPGNKAVCSRLLTGRHPQFFGRCQCVLLPGQPSCLCWWHCHERVSSVSLPETIPSKLNADTESASKAATLLAGTLRGAREGASEQGKTGPKKPKVESQGWNSQ